MKFHKVAQKLMIILALLFLVFTLIMIFSPYKGVVVTTNSMTPSIPQWSFVITGPKATIKTNDVVLFNAQKEKALVIHRVTGIDRDSNLIMTKGDMNAQDDLFPVSSDEIMGVYMMHIPYIGWLVKEAREHAVAIVLVVLFIYLGYFLRLNSKRSVGHINRSDNE